VGPLLADAQPLLYTPEEKGGSGGPVRWEVFVTTVRTVRPEGNRPPKTMEERKEPTTSRPIRQTTETRKAGKAFEKKRVKKGAGWKLCSPKKKKKVSPRSRGGPAPTGKKEGYAVYRRPRRELKKVDIIKQH